MIAFRLAAAHDRQFIISGWSSSFRTSHSAGMIHMDDWADVMHRQIVRVLDRPSVVTLVAYDTEETDRIADLAGFIAFDNGRTVPVVYYVYVPQTKRRLGIARSLFRRARIDPTKPFAFACKTAIVSQLKAKIPCAKWTPLTARFDEEKETAA